MNKANAETNALEKTLQQTMNDGDMRIYPNSIQTTQSGLTLAMIEREDADVLAIAGVTVGLGFQGENVGEWLICPLTHENRVALNRILSFTSPSPLGRDTTSIGLGDRLGVVGAAQLKAIDNTCMKPVLSQQSMREMNLTGRTFDDVIDAASWSVFRYGWKSGWAADGDHLKRIDDIRAAVHAGCTMITLDCSDELGKPSDRTDLVEKDTLQAYLCDPVLHALGIPVSENTMLKVMRIYDGAIALAQRVWESVLAPAGQQIDFEISLDETSETTTYLAHYYTAAELERRNVLVNSLAPRFVGEFHKGVDYKGDLQAFAADIAMHAKIADHFGYKLSIHSGSDKFSVFPLIGVHTRGRFHIKTAGTNWLSAIRVIAERDPALYRRIHAVALENFQKARSYYEVHTDLTRIPDITTMADDALPKLFEADDSRQLIHITYGFLIGKGAPLSKEIFSALRANRVEVDEHVCTHIAKHIETLGLGKTTFYPKLSLTMTPKIIGSAPFLYEGDFREGIRYANGLGYDCVEIHVAKPGELDLERLQETLKETGTSVSALGTGRVYVNDGLSLIDDIPEVRQSAINRLRQFLDAASLLKCIVIIGCVRGNVPDMRQYSLYLDRFAEGMRKLDAYASKKSVTMVLEPINRYENNFLCNVSECAEFIGQNALTHTKILLDTFHMNIEEADFSQCVGIYAPYIAYVHAADSNRLVPGKGHIDFVKLLQILFDAGYKGVVSAELLPFPTKDDAAHAWLRSMRAILERLPCQTIL
ncbi:MAG: tagaturonate epimerase family protein [Eubacteriales bacterium]|nr:tagaturonate epimerase family protein [Eubacteriales bacterium]